MKAQSKIDYINIEKEPIVNDRIFINGYNEIITSLTEKNKDGVEVTLLGTSELILKELLGTDIDLLYYAPKQPKQIFIANEY